MSDVEANDLRFETVDDANLERLSDSLDALNQDYLGEACGEAYWRWKYLESPGGPSHPVVAFKGDRAIGKRGSVRVPMIVDGCPVRGAVSEGLYIRPADRAWPCFMGLLEASRKANARDRVAVSFAISTPMAAPMSQRFGAVKLGPAPAFARRLGRAPITETTSLHVRPVERFDASTDDLWRNMAERRNVAVIKDAAYLNWRFIDHPSIRYACFAAERAGELAGLAAFSVVDSTEGLATPREGESGRGPRRGRLLELLARDDDAETLWALLLAVLREMQSRQVDILVASTRPGSVESEALRRAGFALQSPQFWNVDFTVQLGRRDDLQAARDMRNWQFSLGDWMLG